MDKTPVEPSLAVSDAVTRTPLELPLLPSQPDQHSVEKDFHSSSLPHLGDFMTKLLDDAYKLQSLNVEFERTKQLLREAEEKLASFEEPKSSLSTQLNRTKNQLRKAEAKLASTEKALRKEQKNNKDNEAHITVLLDQWRCDQDYCVGMQERRDEAESKLLTLESHANDLEAELKRKNDALDQKDEAFQMKIHGYKAALHRLSIKNAALKSIMKLLDITIRWGIKSDLIPRTYKGEDLLQELKTMSLIRFEVKEDITDLSRELERDLRLTKGNQ